MRKTMNPIATDNGRFKDGNPATGEYGTVVTAQHMNNVQDSVISMQNEIITVLNEAGITVNADDNTQLWQALQMIAGQVESIDALRKFEPLRDRQIAFVKGYYAGSNKGGGYFIADLSDTTTADNSGIVIVTASGKRWKRIYTEITPFDFGAKCSSELNTEGLTFDVSAINNALKHCPTVFLPAGEYFINTSIAIPSNTALVGSGWDTVIKCTDDMPRYKHMVVNSEGDYITYNISEAEMLNAIKNNKGNHGIQIRNLSLRGDLDTRLIMTRSGVCFKNVKNSVISNVKVSWVGYHGIDIADATEGQLVNYDSLRNSWEDKPSSNVLIEKCLVEYHGDDGYTTRYSTDLTFRDCVARYGAQIFSAENGFEIDDGSRNVCIENCIAVREQCGFVVKRHNNAKTAQSVRLNNCAAQYCGYGYWFYGIQTLDAGAVKNGNYSDAYGIDMNNCISMFTRKQERINQRAIRDLIIEDFTGININNFTVFGWHLEGKIKAIDVSDYQPLYTNSSGNLDKVSDSMLPYSNQVFDNGKDVTKETTVNIFIAVNSRNISINNLNLIGCQATNAHVYMLSATEGVKGINLQNINAVDCSGANVIGVPSDCPTDLSVSNVQASSQYDVSNYYVFAGSAMGNIIKRVDLNSVRYENYAGAFKFGAVVALNSQSYRKRTSVMGEASNSQAVSETISTSGVAIWEDYKNYADSIHKLASSSNSIRYLTKDGLALWLGTFDASGNQTPKCGLHSNGNFIPYANNTYQLGQSTNIWSAIYIDTPSQGDNSKKGINSEWFNSRFSSQLSRNGWRKLPDGTIEQWGHFDINNGSTFNFPIAFTDVPYVVQCADYNATGDQVYAITVRNVTSTGFSVITHSAIGAFTMRAIGR
ncbi:hypothetical protein BMT54_09970 [Pasteurellaceae bacterium 15-036681]|nr:hypothetical protein BMT54_09970 [Pasteurellaceae bacterium 15-036681]